MRAYPGSVLLLVSQIGFASWPACAAPNLEEGSWEVTMKMEMQGMPFDMPPVKHTQCLTRRDAVPATAPADQNCKTTGQTVTGDTVTWKVACTDKDGMMQGEGRITYAGRRFDGAMQMKTTSRRGETANMKYQFQGRYLGACEKSQGPRARKPGDY